MKYLKAKGDLEKLKEGTVDSKYQYKIYYVRIASGGGDVSVHVVLRIRKLDI